MDNNEDKIIEIFSGTLWESEMITTLLNEEGIESFLKNSVLNTYAYNPVFLQEVKVLISESDIEILRNCIINKCMGRFPDKAGSNLFALPFYPIKIRRLP